MPSKTLNPETLQTLLDHRVDLTSKSEVEGFLTHGKVNHPIKESSSLINKMMKIFHFPLYWIWLWMKPKVEDEVFTGTWKFLIGFGLALVWYLILILLAVCTSLGSWALTFLIMAWLTLWKNTNSQE